MIWTCEKLWHNISMRKVNSSIKKGIGGVDEDGHWMKFTKEKKYKLNDVRYLTLPSNIRSSCGCIKMILL